MKIGIDGTPLTIPFPCGTKTYAEQLIKHLSEIDQKNEYVIFVSKQIVIPKQNNFRIVQLPNFPILKKQLLLPYFLKKENVDVFHCLDSFGPIFLGHPRVISTVLDVQLKNTYPWFSRFFLNRAYCELTRRAILKSAKAIICISNTTKDEVLKLNYKAKIDTIHLSSDNEFKNTNAGSSPLKNYFLAMGDFSKRKNIPRVIEAYSKLPKILREIYKLKIVVSTNKPSVQFSNIAAKFGVQNQINFIIKPTTKKLVRLYNNAVAFIYASLYEGFGIPILEAFNCGCPVITSSYGAMKEVAGNAALLVNPESIEDISKAMNKLAVDKVLREKMSNLGFLRANKFSWKQTAKKHLLAYIALSHLN